MIAGPRSGATRAVGRAPVGRVADRGPWSRWWAWVTARVGGRVAVPLALYAVAVALLTVRLGEHPGFAYNWESYTAWRFFTYWEGAGRSLAGVFALNDGLMTDSGQGPLVGLPVWIGFEAAGVGLTAMRLPVALVAAAAVPLLWLVGRRPAGPGVAALAALLLALSPVYLLYARTATLVGISLVPALLTVHALLRVLTAARGWIRAVWLVGLQVALVAGAYAYAPVRLLWPLSVALLAVEAWSRPERRRWLLVALVVTAGALPAALAGIERATAADPDPRGAILRYFDARGEQVLALREAPEGYRDYLRLTPEEEASGEVRGSPEELAWRLVRQNAGDLARLLLDRGTRPALTDHWNAQGRLWPGMLVPFFGLGLAGALWRAIGRSRTEDRVLLGVLGGLTLPLLLTSRVHVGRLVPALPFLLLVAAGGGALAAGAVVVGVKRLRRGWAAGGAAPPRLLAYPLAAALLVVVGWFTWQDYREPPPRAREERWAAVLEAGAEAARARGGAALVADPALGPQIEAIHAAAYRLALDGEYRFVDLNVDPAAARSSDDGRPPLYVGGLLDRLDDARLPNVCGNLYFVAPEAEEAFVDVLGPTGVPVGCEAPVRYEVLPA